MAYLAQPSQQQTLEWLDGGLFTSLLHSQATEGQLGVGRFDIHKGEALVWVGDECHELSKGGVVYLTRSPTAPASRPTAQTSPSSPPRGHGGNVW
jgi:hypothetical protein